MALNKSGLLEDGDWFAFLDADEYLNIHLGEGRVDDLIAKIGARKGMIIPWRLFGDGGTTGLITRQISEEFCMAETQPSGKPCHVKSIFRYQRGELEFTYGNMHRPQIVKGAELSLDDFLLAGDVPWNEERDANKSWIAGSRSGGSAYIGESEFCTEYAQINHYAVRNRDMFGLKKKRGRGFFRKKDAEAAPRVRHNDNFYRSHNLNDVEDRSILRHTAALDKLIDTYLNDPSIRLSHENTLERARKELAMNDSEAKLDEGVNSPSTIRLDTDSEELFLPKITMPEAETKYLTEKYRSAQTILEYGSGGSTVFAATLPHHPKLFSMETDQAWSEKLGASIKTAYPDSDIHMRYTDIGKTKAWGRPKGHQGYLRYPDYSFGIYKDPEFVEPDLILIDGRFRQACFYAALFRMSKPVTILWDDYTNRKRYHGVEKYFEPVETVGRMARFEVEPMAFPSNDIVPVIKAIMDSE